MTHDDKDPTLEQAWRAHSREAPPAALDEKILAAAHRAVASAPRKLGAEATRPPRWWTQLAAAAVIGAVAIGIVQLVPQEPVLDTSPAVSSLAKKQKEADQVAPATNAPAAPAESPPPTQSPPPVAAAKPRTAPSPLPAPPTRSRLAEQKLATPPLPEPFPAAPVPQKTESARDADAKRDTGMTEKAAQPAAPAQSDELRKDARNERQVAPAAAIAPAPPPAAAAAPAPSSAPLRGAMRAQSEAAPAAAAGAVASTAQKTAPLEGARLKARDPDAWIVRIRKLRDDGQVADALRELKSFRELVPDAERRLPPDLRDWKP